MNDSRLTDIINRCKKGDSAAYESLIDIYSDRLFGYFYRLTGNRDTAGDLLGDLYLRLVEKMNTFRGDAGSFNGWLFTIASNLFRDFLKKKYSGRKMLEGKAEMLSLEDGGESGNDELLDKLQVQFAKLDDETAELLTMRYYSQMSFKELAEIRKEPIGTTLSKVHRGLRRLKEMMGIENEQK